MCLEAAVKKDMSSGFITDCCLMTLLKKTADLQINSYDTLWTAFYDLIGMKSNKLAFIRQSRCEIQQALKDFFFKQIWTVCHRQKWLDTDRLICL